MASAAQNKARINFKKAIAYRKKSGCTLKEAFDYVKSGKVGAAKKKTAVKKAAKKAAPKKAAKKTLKYQGVIKKKSGNEYAYKLGGIKVLTNEQLKKYTTLVSEENSTLNKLETLKNNYKKSNIFLEKDSIKKEIEKCKKILLAIRKQKTIVKTLI